MVNVSRRENAGAWLSRPDGVSKVAGSRDFMVFELFCGRHALWATRLVELPQSRRR